jgi:hypothetical protein
MIVVLVGSSLAIYDVARSSTSCHNVAQQRSKNCWLRLPGAADELDDQQLVENDEQEPLWLLVCHLKLPARRQQYDKNS